MAVTFSSDRTFASMSFTLSFANTGVNNPSFIFSFSRGPDRHPNAAAALGTPPAPRALRDLCLFVANAGPHAAVAVAFQNSVDNTGGTIPVVERCERGGLRLVGAAAARNEAVNIPHHVAERIRPRLLMAAGQMRVTARAFVQQ